MKSSLRLSLCGAEKVGIYVVIFPTDEILTIINNKIFTMVKNLMITLLRNIAEM